MADSTHGYFFTRPMGTATFERSQDGSKANLKNWAVFKAGTFRDSIGREHTYTQEDLDTMVANYTVLQILQPPVRVDHTRSVKNVAGYVTKLSSSNGVLYADAELTEPDVIDRWERGTYRHRSAEIGPYMSNTGDIHEPAFLGVAFVDIPAVEGLSHFAADLDSDIAYYMEAGMPTDTKDDKKAEDTAPGRRADLQLDLSGLTVNLGHALDDKKDEKKDDEPVKFSFQGEQLTQEEIETRIAAFAAAQQEQQDANRAAFVTKLATDKKIAAPQIDEYTAFAKAMTADQFTAWSALFEKAPILSILEDHADGVSNPDNAGQGDTDQAKFAAELEILEETVKMHRYSGLPEDQVKETESFKRLAALKGTNK